MGSPRTKPMIVCGDETIVSDVDGPPTATSARREPTGLATIYEFKAQSQATFVPPGLTGSSTARLLPGFLPSRADHHTEVAQIANDHVSCPHLAKSAALTRRCAQLKKELAEAKKSEARLREQLARIESSGDVQKVGVSDDDAHLSKGASHRKATFHTVVPPPTGHFLPTRRLSDDLTIEVPSFYTSWGADPSKSSTPTALASGLKDLGVISAAATKCRHLADASGLATKVYTHADFREGDNIQAAFSATALDRRPDCGPVTNSKFVQANGFRLQACLRYFVVIGRYADCVKALPIESAGGNGPSDSRMQHGTVMLLIDAHGTTRYNILPVLVASMFGDAISSGSFIDLTQDRPISYKEKITRVGAIHGRDIDHLMTAWHGVTDDCTLRDELANLSAEYKKLKITCRDLSNDKIKLRDGQSRLRNEKGGDKETLALDNDYHGKGPKRMRDL